MLSEDTTVADQPPSGTLNSKQPDTKPSGESTSGSEKGDLSLCGPSLRPNPTCDWGHCSRKAVMSRLWRGRWLPVCTACGAAP